MYIFIPENTNNIKSVISNSALLNWNKLLYIYISTSFLVNFYKKKLFRLVNKNSLFPPRNIKYNDE